MNKYQVTIIVTTDQKGLDIMLDGKSLDEGIKVMEKDLKGNNVLDCKIEVECLNMTESEKPLKDDILQALGEASMCWSKTPKGVFDSERVKKIGNKLLSIIRGKK